MHISERTHRWDLKHPLFTQTEVSPLLLSRFSFVWVFKTLWTVTCQAPLSFSTNLNLWGQTNMPIEGLRNGAQSVSRVHKNVRKEILLCLNTKGKKKTEKKIKIYKCLIKCPKKNETLRQLHEFLNLGITDHFGFKSSHFQRIPRFNANNCCVSWTLTVCQALVQNVWPRLSHSGSLPCEVHTATVLVFWRLGQASTLSAHPTVTHTVSRCQEGDCNPVVITMLMVMTSGLQEIKCVTHSQINFNTKW